MSTNDARINRRQLLRTATFGGLALRSVATGLPASLLLRPGVGRTQSDPRSGGPGRILMLFCSQSGDPVNANVPGCYGPGAEEVAHSADPRMAPTQLRLSGRQYTAAKPWADLPQSVLDQTVFFHHATYTPVHQDQSKVMKLMGATDDDEMLVSILSKALAPKQGSVQAVPLSLGARGGSELLTARGQILANVGPRSIARALGGPTGSLANLAELRDREIDRIYALYREHGTKHDVALLDAWARSRNEVRSVSDELVSRLDAIDNDNEDSQVTAAAVLAGMNITPALTLRGTFGGDNHNDGGLARETTQTVSGVARMGRLMAEVDALQRQGVLRHEVIVGTLNVFGRTLRKKGTAGRDHNRGHHVTVMMGPGLRGSVIGSIERSGNDYVSTAIDSTTGAGGGGDIPFEETLGSMAKTLGTALGVDRATLDAHIELGKPVTAALA
ncbi:MAG: hypothetical protein AAFU79_00030 [Myxococcota bacterium]